MIEIMDLTVECGVFSLKGISLTIETGSCHVVIGPSGCGKTTFLETILGLRNLKRGRIIVEGMDVTSLPVHRRKFSYVPQDLAIFPHLSVEENILYGVKHGNVEKKHDIMRELVKSLEITHLLKREVKNLSGGEIQRVALARALSSGNKYLLLDEPFSALHEGLKRELWFLLKELQRKYELTVVMVTHHMEEAFFLADNISVMVNGIIHQTGRKDMVYRHPATREVAKFFGIKNIFEGEITGIENDHYRVYSREIGVEISLPKEKIEKAELHSSLVFGIKPEEIMILKPELPFRKGNLVSGMITSVYYMGARVLVIFKPDRSDRMVEITIPEFAFAKLKLKPFMNVTVALPGERLFVFKN